jgi:ketose-bisphosphate aldolase
MTLNNYSEIFEYGKMHHITIGGLNSANMETLQGIVAAANEMDTPVIVQTYFAHLNFAGANYMSALARAAAANSKVKIAMGLDHGQSFEQAKLCIENGFSGVMIDLAEEDLAYNIRETKKVVELAHANGASVEAEIGRILDADRTPEEIATGYTDPKEARRFVEETNIDCLAVSIGTAHGMYQYTPKINYELLEKLIATIPCPIAVHGGSGTPDSDVLRMVKAGINKLNIGTELFNAYKRAMFEVMQEKGLSVAPEEVMIAGREAVKRKAMEKMALLTKYRV